MASSLLHAEKLEWSDIGLRFGIDSESSVAVRSYEFLSTLNTPWVWSSKESIEIELSFELGLGALDGEEETAFFGHFGPALEIEFGEFPLELILSSGPSILSEHEFDTLDLGGSFQFMSAVGFDYEMGEKWTLGYRYLHISNAGIQNENPGLDFHAVSLFYSF